MHLYFTMYLNVTDFRKMVTFRSMSINMYSGSCFWSQGILHYPAKSYLQRLSYRAQLTSMLILQFMWYELI